MVHIKIGTSSIVKQLDKLIKNPDADNGAPSMRRNCLLESTSLLDRLLYELDNSRRTLYLLAINPLQRALC